MYLFAFGYAHHAQGLLLMVTFDDCSLTMFRGNCCGLNLYLLDSEQVVSPLDFLLKNKESICIYFLCHPKDLNLI